MARAPPSSAHPQGAHSASSQMQGGGSSSVSGNCLLTPSAHLQGAHSVPSQMRSSGSSELSGNRGLFIPSARQRQTSTPPPPRGVTAHSARQGTFTGPLLCSAGTVLSQRRRILPHLDWACCQRHLLPRGQRRCRAARGRSFLPHLDWACLWRGSVLWGPGCSAHLDPLCRACLARGGWQLGPSGIGNSLRQAHCCIRSSLRQAQC